MRGKQSWLKVPGWETLAFIDQPGELEAVRKQTGDMFLGGQGNTFLGMVLGSQSVFLLDHDRHKMARRILAPPLSHTLSRQFQPVIDDIIAEELPKLSVNRNINIGTWSRYLTMRILGKMVLGLERKEDIDRLFRKFEATTGLLANIVSYCSYFWEDRRLTPGGYAAYLVRQIDREIYSVIHPARESYRDNPEADLPPVLLALIRGQKEYQYDDGFIRDNLVSLLAAGYDTTGCALSWSLFWAGKETGIFARFCRAWRKGDEKPLKAFRDEVLRYCPPVEILPRRIDPEKVSEARSVIPSVSEAFNQAGEQGPMVCPFVHRAHHNPDIYQNPDRFDPQRFLQHSHRVQEYFPFGTGRRICVGMHYGKLIMDRVLGTLADRNMAMKIRKRRFQPVRRNVSIWPAFFLYGRAWKDKERKQGECQSPAG